MRYELWELHCLKWERQTNNDEIAAETTDKTDF